MISSPADSSAKKPATRHQKPQADVYTALLAIALAAIIAAIVCLFLHNKAYEWDYRGGPIVSAGQNDLTVASGHQVILT
jgi:hypothetical protein